MLRILPTPYDNFVMKGSDPLSKFILYEWMLETEEDEDVKLLLNWRIEGLVTEHEWPTC